MQPTDFCLYVDHKGKQHKAQADEVHPHQVFGPVSTLVETPKLVHSEPLVDLSYINPATGLREKVIGLKHVSHPDKQETNPAMPTIHLHCWKRLGEEHTAPAEDHPIFDHPHEQNQQDEFGKVIVKSRPKHEAMIAAHREAHGIPDVENPTVVVPEDANSEADRETAAAARIVLGIQHERTPGIPGTVHFAFSCPVCGQDVRRIASHQGGAQFEPEADKDGSWTKHACPGPREVAEVDAPVAEQEPENEPSVPAHSLETVEGEVTIEELGKHLPVISVVLSSTTGAYEGVQVVLPGGRTHIVKANGFDQDRTDVIRFIHVNGFSGYVNGPSVAEFLRIRAEKENGRSRGRRLVVMIGSFPEGSHLKVSLGALQLIIETARDLTFTPISPDSAMIPEGAVVIDKRLVFGDPTIPDDVDSVMVVEKEVDVIHELENAPPAPDEPKSQGQNDGEQAEG